MARILSTGAALLLGCATVWSAGRGAGLEILSEKTLTAELSPPMDIRWAGDGAVYIARARDGVAEIDLATLATRQQMVPDAQSLHGFLDFSRIGVSGANLVVAAPANDLAMRRLGRTLDNGANLIRLRIGLVDGLDVAGDRLLLLGLPLSAVKNGFAPTGTIAWLGPLRALWDGEGLQPLLSDVAGPGAQSLGMCATIPLGAARFLDDGTALVVPGVQPGVHLFGASGRPLRSWDSHKLGIDAVDCAAMDRRDAHKLRVASRARAELLNSHRVVDEVLPLHEGPGLVIRYVEGGKVHWQLKILQSGDRVLAYDLPFTGNLPFDRLRGDVRDDRIAFLVSEHEAEKDRPQVPARLILARLSATRGTL